LKSFRKFLNGNPKRKDDPNYSLTLLDFAKRRSSTFEISHQSLRTARQEWKLKGRDHEVQAERFKQFFKAQFEMGVIPSNPAKDLKKPKVDKDQVVALDRDQRDRPLDAVKCSEG